jgi:hypothetical protein
MHGSCRTPTDFSGFFHQLQQEKQHGGHPSSILQHAPPQHNLQGVHDGNLQQQQQYTELGGARTLPQSDLHNFQQQQRQYSAAPTLDQLLTDHDLGSKHRQPDRELKHVSVCGGQAACQRAYLPEKVKPAARHSCAASMQHKKLGLTRRLQLILNPTTCSLLC